MASGPRLGQKQALALTANLALKSGVAVMTWVFAAVLILLLPLTTQRLIRRVG